LSPADRTAPVLKRHSRTLAHGRPISLDLALKLLPLAACQSDSYDVWACRWLARWLSESGGPSIDHAADLAAALADLPSEPQALQTILGILH
jgi:hypothetical protein